MGYLYGNIAIYNLNHPKEPLKNKYFRSCQHSAENGKMLDWVPDPVRKYQFCLVPNTS